MLALVMVFNATSPPPSSDWLINPSGQARHRSDEHRLILENDLIRLEFTKQPNASLISIKHLDSGREWLRAIKPEAQLELNGSSVPVGGLTGQPNMAYLTPEWIGKMTAIPGSFLLKNVRLLRATPKLKSKPWNSAAKTESAMNGWEATFDYSHPAWADLSVQIHYAIYDQLPVIEKWITIQNRGQDSVRLDRFQHMLGLVESESIVDDSPEWIRPDITVLTDYSFGGMSTRNSNKTVHWNADASYKTQVNYNLQTPCDLVVRPPFGPAIDLRRDESYESFRTIILLHDSSERERKGLAVRRVFRSLAPWTRENPIMLHLTSTEPDVVRRAVDQAAECGFEMVILSFGSGLNMEDDSDENIAKFRELREYANSRGVGLGGYSLLASRSIDSANNVVNPKPIFGNSPCLGSTWGQSYFQKIKSFLERTGFNLLEHDGSYPGDTCASTAHPGHRDFDDSQYRQHQAIADLYRWCRERGIFLNVPDNYFLNGSNKTGMGYRETNWSLPRAQQHVHARQNLFDGTWEKTPSMGWMFTPLVEYHGGGPEATIEPLKDHLDDYEMHLVNNFAYGAQSCYRGPRIYDSPETKAMVVKWVTWFKEHRRILESDVIHLRRADGRNIDGVLHVDPQGPLKAMAVLFNPTSSPLTENFPIDLRYSGLGSDAVAAIEGPKILNVTRRLTNGRLSVTVPPKSFIWVKFE